MRISNLTYRINKSTILDNISIKLQLQGINWVFGPNGAGKSSLLKVVCGLGGPYQGSINWEISLPKLPRVGFIIDRGSYFGHLTIKENLSLYKNHYEIDQHRINEFLMKWDLQSCYHRRINSLSMGQCARFKMVMAMIHDPQLLALDEPDNNLDPTGVATYNHLFNEWRINNNLTVIASHRPGNMVAWDHMTVLHNGTLLYSGTVELFLSEPAIPANGYMHQLRSLIKKGI